MFKISDENAENVRRDEELGTWLNGIPNANAPPCLNLHHEHVAIGSSASRVSLTSNSSPTRSFSNGFHFYGDAFLDSKHQTPKLWLDSDKCVDDVGLCEDFSGMNIFHGQRNGAKTRGYAMDSCHCQHICNGVHPIPNYEGTGTSTPSSTWGVLPSFVADMKWALPASAKGYTFSTPVESSLYSGSSWNSSQIYHLMDQGKKQGSSSFDREVQLHPYLCDRFMCSQPFRIMDCEAHECAKNPLRFSQTMRPKLALNLESPSHYYCDANSELPQCLSPRRAGGDPVAFKCDNSFIIQGKDVKCDIDKGCNSLTGCKKNCHNEVAIQIVGEKVPQHTSHNSTLASDIPQPLLLNFYSLAEVQGYIYHLAKDQNGCRFLQRMVDEGTSEDMRIVFKGIIDNVVELMMDPFGNYLVQKLLDVCREDQRLQIVLMLTKEPGQLVRTSSNTHGTRVVQKLIETLNSRKQISLVRSAIQPCFLDLIKDLNGNHVIQRCLQCLSCQDNEFIFDAAAKFCVDIATHRHGCCVLQRCIDHSMGKYQDKLVTEICRHGLLLAQDPFGNYVVQYIIEMEIPTASTKLIAQFKGNYVNLSMQKFSSHVIEKCLKHVGESRSRIVRELLSAPHLEQLLQDPYANYVIQSALAVTKGSLHASLVEAVRPHKILRTSPYCKRIFSGSLLKK